MQNTITQNNGENGKNVPFASGVQLEEKKNLKQVTIGRFI